MVISLLVSLITILQGLEEAGRNCHNNHSNHSISLVVIRLVMVMFGISSNSDSYQVYRKQIGKTSKIVQNDVYFYFSRE